MSAISSRQVNIRSGGSYPTLEAFLDQRIVKPIPFIESQKLTVSAGDQFAYLTTATLSGTVSKGVGSLAVQAGVVAAALAGAVGTAAITSISDSNGAVVNLVEIKDDATGDPLVDANDRRIWGLVQCSASATDNDPIGAPGSENLQMSFVVIDANDDFALTALSATASTVINYQVNRLYSARWQPSYRKEGVVANTDVMAPKPVAPYVRVATVTTAYPAAAVIDISTGAGTPSGASTMTGDVVTLPTSLSSFNTNNLVQVYRNGVLQRKNADVIWDSTSSLHFAGVLDVADEIQIFIPQSYV